MKNEKGFTHLLLLTVAIAGILVFILLASAVPLKDKLFSLLFPKPSSYASAQLPGQQTWNNGVSSYLFGLNDTASTWANPTFSADSTVQQSVKDAHFTLMRTWFFDGSYGAGGWGVSINSDGSLNKTEIDRRLNAITNSGMTCLGVLWGMDNINAYKNLIAYIGNRCIMYEFGNEPDNSNYAHIDSNTYSDKWIAAIPQFRAVNPNAKFFGPATMDGTWNSAYAQTFLQRAKAANVIPDGITFHHYPCWNVNDVNTCVNNASALGNAVTNHKQIIRNILGYDLPVGITEWNISETNTLNKSDTNFIHNFDTAAINSMISAGTDFANHFCTENNCDNGRLDLFINSLPKFQFTDLKSIVAKYYTSGSTPLPTSVPSIWRIEAGSTISITDGQGNTWLADQGFNGGGTVDRGNITIENTNTPKIYQTEHYGMTQASYNVPPGKYMVTLGFAETYSGVNGPGQRIFDVAINGITVLPKFDVYAQAGGSNKAMTKNFTVDAINNGQINIVFTPITTTQPAEINSIEILPVVSPPTPIPTSTQTPKPVVTPTPLISPTPTPQPIITPTPKPTSTPTPQVLSSPATNSFTGEYWNSGTGSSPSIPTTATNFVRNDSKVNFSWGNGSPANGINADHFISRWRGNFTFNNSNYRFVVTADDGVRLYIDNQLILDKWYDQSPTTYTVDKSITAGIHQIRMEYYENVGDAVAQLSWATKLEGESMSLSSSLGMVYTDSLASGGKGLMIWSNGTSTANFKGVINSLVVLAKGDQCNGAPHMKVAVDGGTVLDTYVGNTQYASYNASVTRGLGSHKVAVTFDNDIIVSGLCDRNLEVDLLLFPY